MAEIDWPQAARDLVQGLFMHQTERSLTEEGGPRQFRKKTPREEMQYGPVTGGLVEEVPWYDDPLFQVAMGMGLKGYGALRRGGSAMERLPQVSRGGRPAGASAAEIDADLATWRRIEQLLREDQQALPPGPQRGQLPSGPVRGQLPPGPQRGQLPAGPTRQALPPGPERRALPPGRGFQQIGEWNEYTIRDEIRNIRDRIQAGIGEHINYTH